MESSSVNGLCRCCASEGAFKDIKTSYHWMGEEEVYGDMLRECFDVNLSSADQGGICEVCITQLRNASNFKKQVLRTENQFKQHLRTNKGFKACVKEERSTFDDESDENDMDNIDDEDYVPEYEMPIKTESESEEKPKKRGAKTVSTRAKKSKSNEGDATVKSNLLDEDAEETENDSDEAERAKATPIKEMTKKDKFDSMKEVLLWSNATLIRKRDEYGCWCCYCVDVFSDPKNLKKHVIETHNDEEKLFYFKNCGYDNIHPDLELDITSLSCKFCKEDIPTLTELIEHLKASHNKILNDNSLICHICLQKFSKIYHKDEHMTKYHGAPQKVFPCKQCDKSFTRAYNLTNHVRRDHIMERNFECTYCDKKFFTFSMVKNHMLSHTGERRFRCEICSKRFAKNTTLNTHMRIHNNDRPYKCPHCDKAFVQKVVLQGHMKCKHKDAIV